MTRTQRKALFKAAVLATITPPATTPGFDAIAALDDLERAGGRAVFRGDRLHADGVVVPGTHADWLRVEHGLVEWAFGRSIRLTPLGLRRVIASRWKR